VAAVPPIEHAEAIKASDIAKLMAVVGAAAGLFNRLEREYYVTQLRPWGPEFRELGQALRDLGLPEVPL
jgi:hypothetical protein